MFPSKYSCSILNVQVQRNVLNTFTSLLLFKEMLNKLAVIE